MPGNIWLPLKVGILYVLDLKTLSQGITGTTIKDTWTKSRGRVKVGGVVGSAGVGWREGEKRHTAVTE